MKTTAEMRATYMMSMGVSHADALEVLQEHERDVRADERQKALQDAIDALAGDDEAGHKLGLDEAHRRILHLQLKAGHQ